MSGCRNVLKSGAHRKRGIVSYYGGIKLGNFHDKKGHLDDKKWHFPDEMGHVRDKTGPFTTLRVIFSDEMGHFHDETRHFHDSSATARMVIPTMHKQSLEFSIFS